MYVVISGHEKFQEIRDTDFFYDSCIKIENFNSTAGTLTLPSFGGQAWASLDNLRFSSHGEFDWNLVPYPRPGLKPVDVHHYITLTDNESFIFMHNCLGGTERGFSVASTNPVLEPQTMKQIEQHALSLGFRSEHMVFWRRETCGEEEESDNDEEEEGDNEEEESENEEEEVDDEEEEEDDDDEEESNENESSSSSSSSESEESSSENAPVGASGEENEENNIIESTNVTEIIVTENSRNGSLPRNFTLKPRRHRFSPLILPGRLRVRKMKESREIL